MKISDALTPNGKCHMCGAPVKPDELFCTMQCFLSDHGAEFNRINHRKYVFHLNPQK